VDVVAEKPTEGKKIQTSAAPSKKPQQPKPAPVKKEKKKEIKKVPTALKVPPVEQNITKGTLFNLEGAGKEYTNVDDQNKTKQNVELSQKYMIINFSEKEVSLDDPIIKKVKSYIKDVKKKFPNSYIEIAGIDPQNVVSATIAKQISLARVLNVRNLCRKLWKKKKDVRINLSQLDKVVSKFGKKKYGYVIIFIRQK
jgi:hypothetical protein